MTETTEDWKVVEQQKLTDTLGKLVEALRLSRETERLANERGLQTKGSVTDEEEVDEEEVDDELYGDPDLDAIQLQIIQTKKLMLKCLERLARVMPAEI